MVLNPQSDDPDLDQLPHLGDVNSAETANSHGLATGSIAASH